MIIIEGVIRLAVIVGYMAAIGLLPDVRRIYAYHGAEHKSIHALENGDPLEPAAVQRYPTAHVRCGTSFLLTVVVVSVFVFAAVGDPAPLAPGALAHRPYPGYRGYRVRDHPLRRRVRVESDHEGAYVAEPRPPDSSPRASPTTRRWKWRLTALKEVLYTEGALERVAPEVAAEAEESVEAAPPLD